MSRLAEQFESIEQQEHADRLGMWLFLGSETLLFSGLFALFAAYRAMYGEEFSAAASLNNVTIGTLNTIVLLTSSLTVALSVHMVKIREARIGALLLGISVAFGVLFLVLKGVEYVEHFHEGIMPGAEYNNHLMPGKGPQIFFMLYYLLTGLHALHVIGGMGILSWLFVRCWRGAYTPERHVTLEMGGLYWHMIDILWIFLWPLLYLAR